jgi:hypothetical protein
MMSCVIIKHPRLSATFPPKTPYSVDRARQAADNAGAPAEALLALPSYHHSTLSCIIPKIYSPIIVVLNMTEYFVLSISLPRLGKRGSRLGSNEKGCNTCEDSTPRDACARVCVCVCVCVCVEV